MNATTSNDLQTYAKEKGLVGLSEPSLRGIREGKTGHSVEKGKSFLLFQERINRDLLKHRVIVDNKFTKWWAKGEMSEKQLKAFVVQFSVFSNLFIVAQLKKTLNASSLDGMRASKEILMNELGVVFNNGGKSPEKAADVEPEVVATEGTVEGGVFRHRAAHFEWLVRMCEPLGLGFNDVGKPRHGTSSTIFFCDELSRLYANPDYTIATAASYAVENWAAAGFWKELIQGFERFKKRTGSRLPLAFFLWHDKVEDQHAAHTQEELEEEFFTREVDQDAFIKWGNEMLEGVAAFWDGLEKLRKELS